MAFERPTIQQIIERVNADLESRLTSAQLRRSNAKVYGRVLAGASHELHAHIDYVKRQLFFDTAEAEFLDRWASIFGINRTPATKAAGTVAVIFSAAPVDVPVGTILQADAGAQYQTTGSPAADGSVSVEALVAGAEANLDEGEILAFVSPIAGVESEATSLGISGGADQESDEALRERLLERTREKPCGGSAADYVAWAKEIPGVTRAWVYQGSTAGTVIVRFVCDGLDPIIPDAEMVARVQAHIDEVRPVTAITTVLAPTTKAVNMNIRALTPDTAAVREAIRASLADLFTAEAEPGGTVYISHIRAAISSASGEVDHVLVSPTADQTSDAGQLLVPGTITWS